MNSRSFILEIGTSSPVAWRLLRTPREPRLPELDMSAAISGLMYRGKRCPLVSLFDYLVGELLEMQWHVEPERLGGLEVDDQTVGKSSPFALRRCIGVRDRLLATSTKNVARGVETH